MLDMVLNHLANPGETIKYSEFWPFNEEQYFHQKCDIDWGNQTSIEVVCCILILAFMFLIEFTTVLDGEWLSLACGFGHRELCGQRNTGEIHGRDC
jgi:hypothetical protein